MSWEAPYPAERLVPYDDAWPATAARLADDLVAGLGPDWVVEHVGSTSVPGLAAKPVIDLALRVPPGWPDDEVSTAFATPRSGWSEIAGVGGHRASVRVQDGVRRAVAHLQLPRPAGGSPVWTAPMTSCWRSPSKPFETLGRSRPMQVSRLPT